MDRVPWAIYRMHWEGRVVPTVNTCWEGPASPKPRGDVRQIQTGKSYQTTDLDSWKRSTSPKTKKAKELFQNKGDPRDKTSESLSDPGLENKEERPPRGQTGWNTDDRWENSVICLLNFISISVLILRNYTLKYLGVKGAWRGQVTLK